jgi:hypothetical protein
VIRSTIFAIAAASFLAAHTQAAGTLDDAEDLYFQAKVAAAEQGFRQVLAAVEASPSDKAGAARGLARIAWHIDADGPGALKDLEQARATGVDLCAAARDQVRILREMGRAADAAAYANARGADCSPGSQADGLHIQSAMAELDVAASSQGMPQSLALQRAKTTLNGLSPERRFSGAAQRAHLELALLESNSKSALEAWRGYYWLTDRDAPTGMAVPKPGVAASFRAALGAKPTLEAQISLLRLLLRGGFYQAAQRYDAAARVGVRSGGMPAYAPVAAYYQYRRDLDPTLLDFNRSTARDRGDPAAFTAKVQSLILALAQANQAGVADPAPVLKQVYGLYWALGNTSGFASLHQGHIVEDGRIPVVQFDRKRDLGFISLDNMTANGFQTWLWDGSAETGGWTTDDGIIVQVRSAYTPPVLNGLLSLSPEMQARNAKKLQEREAVDLETLKIKQIAYLPALMQRVDQESIDEIAAAAHAAAQRLNKPFALTFVKLYWDAMIQHSITIHEGRHALDKAQYGEKGLSDAELEYRAKLSELELADYPRMGMSNMMAANLGDGTPHGDANERIYSGLVDWIGKHQSAVAGFDASLPPLEQVDKMTDEQIRAAARELDPQRNL